MGETGPTWRERVLYWFDRKVAAGPRSLLGLLALAALLVVAIAGLALNLLAIAPGGQPPLDLSEGLWESLMRALDPGTMGNDSGWSFRIVMLFVTVAGLFTIAALINILGEGLQKRLTSLRKGRSRVIESGHTVILNWSPAIFDVVSQLAEANGSLNGRGTRERQPCIVIMSERDKVEMEDEIAARCPNLRRTRVICRRGDPTDPLDLRIVAFETARAVIVLSPVNQREEDEVHSDWHVTKSVLALVHGAPAAARGVVIVAQVGTDESVRMLNMVGVRNGRCMVETVLADRLVAQIIVQSCREPGLGDVYEHLLQFDGAEIYVRPLEDLLDWTFGETLLGLEGATAIGVIGADGMPRLRPSFGYELQKDDRLIVLAEDDDAVGRLKRPASGPRRGEPTDEQPDPGNTLILGWNRRGPLVLDQLARYAPSTDVRILADRAVGATERIERPGLTVSFDRLTTDRQAEIAAHESGSYANVVLLGNDQVAPKVADTRSLVKLLSLRRAPGFDDAGTGVVAEVLDVGNRRLAALARAHDYVVSTRLVSLMLAQVAENRTINRIFGELLDYEGPEFRLRSIGDYGIDDKKALFADVFLAAASHGDIVVGLVPKSKAGRSDAECRRIVFNPSRTGSEAVDPEARLIVLGAGPKPQGNNGADGRTEPTSARP